MTSHASCAIAAALISAATADAKTPPVAPDIPAFTTEENMELNTFIAEWNEDASGVKDIFVEFKEMLESLTDTKIHFNARPGISYSMRGEKTSQTERPLFVMVDVIDDDPADRWLSVCFYGDNITDPDELGDFVPGGLLGKDGHCFDLEEREMGAYLAARIAEAHASQ